MAEVSPVAKCFGKFTFFCVYADSEGQNYSQNICILFCRPTQTRKRFQDVPSWRLLLHLAALNENITFQLRSFVHDSKDFQIEGHKLPGICVYFEIKARHVAVQTWK